MLKGMRRRHVLAAAVLLVVSAVLVAVAVSAREPSALVAFVGVVAALLAASLMTAAVSLIVVGRAESRLRSRIGRVEQAVEDSRVKTSRHEWLQEQQLQRLEAAAREVSATTAGLAWFAARDEPPSETRTPKVLFVTSNGGGMGHIARCTAVVRHSGGSIEGTILTMSSAASIVASAGFPVSYFPGQSAAERGTDRWRRQFSRRLFEESAAVGADVIVFDGTWVYPSLTDVAEYSDLPLVWLRRGLWRENSELAQVRAWREHVSSVIVPADIAESKDMAPTEFHDGTWTKPISLAPPQLVGREQALAMLGLPPEQRYALVQLSGGNGDGSATDAAVDAISSVGDVVPVVVRSPLLSARTVSAARTIEARFPLVDIAAAWDFAVTGAGYNSVHENLHTRTPGVYLPSRQTITDDQVKRSRSTAAQGLGVHVERMDDLRDAIAQIADPAHRGEIHDALEERRVDNGASTAGELIARTAIAPTQHRWLLS